MEKKKPYRNPRIEEVRLVIEESVLKVCKVQDIGGPGIGQPITGCKGAAGNQCALLGT